jgi:hypothetical protein
MLPSFLAQRAFLILASIDLTGDHPGYPLPIPAPVGQQTISSRITTIHGRLDALVGLCHVFFPTSSVQPPLAPSRNHRIDPKSHHLSFYS